MADHGETLLAVEQVDTGKTHKDGSQKFVWPAKLPNKVKPNTASYINTGIFIIDRFVDGKPSASAANIEFCWALVLDDVGTKSKVPPLPPTWRIETSPNNFQWGYIYSEQPRKGQQAAALEAIAAAGYTDPGAINPVRNVRLPGSINLKPGRGQFAAVLTEFDKSREYTLDEICAAFGVTPCEASTASNESVRLADDGNDDVLAWLNEHNLILERANSAGWVGVVCPNHAEHTDGQIGGRYHPVSRSYCCLHSHCAHLTSQVFLDWVADQSGPVHEPGIRDDLLANTMARVYERLERGDRFSEATDAEAQIAEAELRELGRLERDKWFAEWVFVVDEGAYYNRGTARMVRRTSFDALYAGVKCMDGKARLTASAWFDRNRVVGGGVAVTSLVYAPGEAAILSRDGELYANSWRDARAVPSPASPKPWLDMLHHVVEDEADREHLLDVMAFKYQYPNRKINHAVLLTGTHGCGKDALLRGFAHAVCGPFERNLTLVDSHALVSQFNEWVESEIIVVNELRPDDFKDRRQVENILKPVIAAPPEFLSCNKKGLRPHKVVNRSLVVAMSNHSDAIALTSEDRRWFVIHTRAAPIPKAEGKVYYDWMLPAGGYKTIAAYLKARDVSQFNPGATPPNTEAKRSMIEMARSPGEQYIIEQIKARAQPFSRGVICGPMFAIMDQLALGAPTNVKLTQSMLTHALSECGWLDMGQVKSAQYATKKRMFCAPGMLESYSRSDLRNLVEEPPATLRAVK